MEYTVLTKVKIFAWLYFKDRLSSRANLFAKHVLDDNICNGAPIMSKIVGMSFLVALRVLSFGRIFS